MESPALSSSFSVGTASRLLVPGEMLILWNDRGAPGASSSSVKPPHPFPPSLLPTLSHQVYNLRCKPVFGLVLARLQATLGPWWGSALPAAVDPPTPGKASISLPTLWPLSLPQLSPLHGGSHCHQPLPGKVPSRLQLIATPFPDLRTITSIPCFIFLIMTKSSCTWLHSCPMSAVPTPACPGDSIPSTCSHLVVPPSVPIPTRA